MLSLEFSDKIALKYYKAIKASIKDFDLIGLTEQNVKNLILSRPEHLKEMNNDFIVKIIPNFNFDEFIAYLKKNKADRAKDLKYYTKISQIKMFLGILKL
ncbi:hypothetical protein AB1278_00050 [Chryseobacterium sp. NRRL B-14798]|uniref:hypothetical protein n=1 Tax=Chryseobacterium sp. NRRL B-14798 TaxID=3162880 RepID=UPI003D2452EA